MSLLVRPERSGDEATISAVTGSAFAHAEHASGTEQLVVEALRQGRALTVSLVAEVDGAVVGHAAISPVTIDPSEVPAGRATPGSIDGWYGLGPVSVRPGHQGRGIGTALVEQALAAIAGEEGCVVLGDPLYYGRFGFRPDPRLVLPGAPPEYFQVLRLAAGEVPHGTVRYHRAFTVDGEG